ncbi:fasciclin domain-containing protein [Maribacter sp. 2210JD10-5]|uniref:fasciclin domain-containing protein n=1 Tax=Maribacter sp. 2210JD10-5 TaxID=3386272 RepID=UPI0039BCD7E2
MVSMVGDNLNGLLDNEFTFFLPTNRAFLELFDNLEGYNSIADFNTVEEIELLITILKYHCVETGKLNADDLINGQLLTTAQGEKLEISIDEGVYVLDKTMDAAKVTASDKELLKGVIHVVDKVLLPEEIIRELSL